MVFAAHFPYRLGQPADPTSQTLQVYTADKKVPYRSLLRAHGLDMLHEKNLRSLLYRTDETNT